jgi:N-hydroxyarylamine O-acetyltransferase
VDLDAYLSRIGLSERPAADLAGLNALQRAQRRSIPFENLDIPLGRGVSLDPDAVFDKLVTRKRGGYCFEQNQLLARALAALGFETQVVLGRVWLFVQDVTPPRTHTFNLVTLDGERWIADAGFGGGDAPPMPLIADTIVATGNGTAHRLVERSDHGWMLERDAGSGFRPQFSFTLDPVAPVDLEMSNHWTSNWPKSRFVTERIANILLPGGVAALMNRTLAQTIGADTTIVEISTPVMLQERLSETFGIELNRAEIDALGLF